MKKKKHVQGSQLKCQPYHSVLEYCWKILQTVKSFQLETLS